MRKKILGEMDALETELKRYRQGALGKLRIGIDRVHHADWLPSVMTLFRTLHPRIELEVKQVPELLHSLQRKENDIAIIGEVIEAAGIDYVPLHEDEMVALLPLNHPLCKKECIAVQDLAGVDMIYYFELEQSCLYRRYLHPNGIHLGSFQRIQDIDAIIELVQSGEGKSILPKRLLADAIRKRMLAVRPISLLGFLFTWYAALSLESNQRCCAEFVGLLKSKVEARAQVTLAEDRRLD